MIRGAVSSIRAALRGGRAQVAIAAAVPSGLYLLYVAHYSVDVPYADDWSTVPLVFFALEGRIRMSELWTQYGDTRLFVPKLFFLLVAWIDHFNIATVLLLGAAMFVLSYLLLLRLLRAYIGTQLTYLPVLAVGIVWFSLADVQNAFWGFQLAWYVVTFFFVAMVSFLLTRRLRVVTFGLGIAAAVAGSYAIVQGFVLWPIGLICLVWNSPWGRRTYTEAAVWIAAAAITIVIYLHGFDTTSTAGSGVSHPHLLIRYMILLMGNVIPTSLYDAHPNFVLHEVLGIAVAAAAAFVVLQSIRERRARNSPLPLLLIAYGLMFDLMISLGRFSIGPAGALNNNRYTMPNLVLLTGIVIYACAHPPAFHGSTRSRMALLGMIGLLVAYCAATTPFGIVNARATRSAHVTDARVVVNLDLFPMDEQGCAAAYASVAPRSPAFARGILASFGRDLMARRELSVFQPAEFRHYRALGPPSHAALVSAGDFAAVRALWAPECR